MTTPVTPGTSTTRRQRRPPLPVRFVGAALGAAAVAAMLALAPPVLWVTYFWTLDTVHEPLSGPAPIAATVSGLALPALAAVLAVGVVRRRRPLVLAALGTAAALAIGLWVFGVVAAPPPVDPLPVATQPGEVDLASTLDSFVAYAETYRAERGDYPDTTDAFFHDRVLAPVALPDAVTFGVAPAGRWWSHDVCITVRAGDRQATWSSADDRGVDGLPCELR